MMFIGPIYLYLYSAFVPLLFVQSKERINFPGGQKGTCLADLPMAMLFALHGPRAIGESRVDPDYPLKMLFVVSGDHRA
jgi:hypothetical protein